MLLALILCLYVLYSAWPHSIPYSVCKLAIVRKREMLISRYRLWFLIDWLDTTFYHHPYIDSVTFGAGGGNGVTVSSGGMGGQNSKNGTVGGQYGITRTEPVSLSTMNRDCFIIPMQSINRFLPEGIPVSIVVTSWVYPVAVIYRIINCFPTVAIAQRDGQEWAVECVGGVGS